LIQEEAGLLARCHLDEEGQIAFLDPDPVSPVPRRSLTQFQTFQLAADASLRS